jgi:hypothetical protein
LYITIYKYNLSSGKSLDGSPSIDGGFAFGGIIGNDLDEGSVRLLGKPDDFKTREIT